MQCPACKSISPEDVRFCLHCGQYFGEPEDVTRVASPLPRAQTTIRAPQWIPAPLSDGDQTNKKKLSGLQLAGIVLVAAFVLCAGIVIGVAIVADNGAPKKTPVVVVSTPTPIVNSLPAISRTPVPTSVETPTPPPSPRSRPTSTEQTGEVYRSTPQPGGGYQPAPPQSGYQPTPEPTRDPLLLGKAVVVIDDSRMLKDGAWVSWQLPPGYYQLNLTSGPDGAAAQWVGTTTCDFKTQEMTQLTQRCKMESQGQLVISNPTRFGLGAAIGVAIRVTRF